MAITAPAPQNIINPKGASGTSSGVSVPNNAKPR